MFGKVRNILKLLILKKQFLNCNRENQTWLINAKSIECITIGKMTWGGINIIDYCTSEDDSCHIYIGNFCSIASDVKFMRGGNHRTDRVSTFLFRSCYHLEGEENLKKSKDICIDDDVWIGYGVLILPGANIGKGAIIGAGSVVRGNIPPYAIYVNDRVVKFRFDEKIIKTLLEFDYSKVDENFVIENNRLFYSHVDKELARQLVHKQYN